MFGGYYVDYRILKIEQKEPWVCGSQSLELTRG